MPMRQRRGNRPRILPIGPRARAALERYGVPLSEPPRSERRALCADMLRLPGCNRRAWIELEGVLDRCLLIVAGAVHQDTAASIVTQPF